MSIIAHIEVKRRPHSQETKDKIKKALLGHNVLSETREKISESLQGKATMSEEHKATLSRLYKGVLKISREIRSCKCGCGFQKEVKVNSSWKFKRGHNKGMLNKNHSEETRRKISENNHSPQGKDCHLWKGGITPLKRLIRDSYEGKEWVEKVFKRDNYTCQECGKYGATLNAHHLKEFAVLFQEFLKEYSQFSPIEDKETLIRLAESYEPFWNISNGKTLCIDCHKETESYLKRV